MSSAGIVQTEAPKERAFQSLIDISVANNNTARDIRVKLTELRERTLGGADNQPDRPDTAPSVNEVGQLRDGLETTNEILRDIMVLVEALEWL